jgi:hypothetical protein
MAMEMFQTGFKRDFYQNITENLNHWSTVFLLGPRKCGKTYALKQMERCLDGNVEYVNFKGLSKTESLEKVSSIKHDIVSGKEKVYLLDECTYMYEAELEIMRLADAYTDIEVDGGRTGTKIVFTGSQSVALEAWGQRAFCADTAMVHVGFLTYPEWLRFKGIAEVSDSTYLDYILGTREFCRAESVRAYLDACIRETIDSNAGSRNTVDNMNCEGLSAEWLENLLYLTMYTLHNRVNAQTFFMDTALQEQTEYMLRMKHGRTFSCPQDIVARVQSACYKKTLSVSDEEYPLLKRGMSFLIRCGLVVATPVTDSYTGSIYVLKELESSRCRYPDKDALFSEVNFTIQYPMFYMEILQDILREEMPGKMDKEVLGCVLGPVVECNVRGILPSTGQHEYRSGAMELDYVHPSEGLAVEISVSNKKIAHTLLKKIPEDLPYKKILLTRDSRIPAGDIIRVPYYEFIYGVSSGGRKFLNSLQPACGQREQPAKEISAGSGTYSRPEGKNHGEMPADEQEHDTAEDHDDI